MNNVRIVKHRGWFRLEVRTFWFAWNNAADVFPGEFSHVYISSEEAEEAWNYFRDKKNKIHENDDDDDYQVVKTLNM